MKLALQYQVALRYILHLLDRNNNAFCVTKQSGLAIQCLLLFFILVSTRYSVRRIQSRYQYSPTYSLAMNQW